VTLTVVSAANAPVLREVISSPRLIMPIRLASLAPHNIIDSIKKKPLGACQFLKLPLEIREIIYGMLLTTPYCTQIAATGWGLDFKLHTAILLVNKQISTEALGVLYHGSDFVILKVTGIQLHLNRIPQFELLSEDKIPRPVLRIEFAIAAGGSRRFPNPGNLISTPEGNIPIINTIWGPEIFRLEDRTIISTPEGIQPIINSIWGLEHFRRYDPKLHHGDLSLTLDFYLKATTRYKVLSKLLLKPWKLVNGFKHLVLKGDIGEPMRELLTMYNLEGPFPSEVADQLTKYHSISKEKFEQKDYLAVKYRGVILDDYMVYLSTLKPHRLGGRTMCEEGNELWNVFRLSLPRYYEERLNLIIGALRLYRYDDVAGYAGSALSLNRSWRIQFGWYEYPHALENKLELCVILGKAALRGTLIDHEFARLIFCGTGCSRVKITRASGFLS
jgi:hypothetical protein